jgi:FtsH-binding integral membrane protein
MYGNLRQAAGTVERFKPPAHQKVMIHQSPPISNILEWELIMLLSAEFLAFAALLTPLLPDTEMRDQIEKFWFSHSLLSLAALSLFIMLTVPVSAGYTWFIKRWPWNMVTWMLIVVSMGSALHIVSVVTDPRGIFLGCVVVGTILLAFSALRMLNRIKFTGYVSWLSSAVWLAAVFLPVCLTHQLSLWSTYGSPAAAVVTMTFILAEFRLMETGTTFGLVPSVNDPYTLSIWLNCAVWRFLVQLGLLLIKWSLHLAVWILKTVWASIKWTISALLSLVPRRWWTPTQTVNRLSHVT